MAPGKAGKHFKGDNPIAGRDPRGTDSYRQGLRVPGAPSQPGALPLWAALITQTASVAFWVKKLRELQRSGLPGDEGNREIPALDAQRWKGSPGESQNRCPTAGGILAVPSPADGRGVRANPQTAAPGMEGGRENPSGDGASPEKKPQTRCLGGSGRDRVPGDGRARGSSGWSEP